MKDFIGWIKTLPEKAIEVWTVTTEIFTNWDSQSQDMVEETKTLFSQFIWFIHWAIEKISGFFGELIEMLTEMLNNLRRGFR